jgi:ATP-binding cassette, subfamily G (WHITE), member 2, SNQ2
VFACTLREFWPLWGDKTSLYTKFFIIVSNGLIVDSLFYGQPPETAGAFSHGGTPFFAILFLGWLQLTDLMKVVSGRVVVAQHREYAFYRPLAVSIARVVLDLPVLLVQVIIFGLILYFMTDLVVDVSKFFIFELFVYTGYVIPKPLLLSRYIWFGWLYYINPIFYAYESVLANEFSGRTMQCSSQQLIPQGPQIRPEYQGCALTVAKMCSTIVTGEAYIDTSFSYTKAHLWRNFGVVIAFTILYIIVTVIASEVFSFARTGGGALVFKKMKDAKQLMNMASSRVDEEKVLMGQSGSTSSVDNTPQAESQGDKVQDIIRSESVFTSENVEYTVPYQREGRKLLNNVNGYARLGVMIVFIGASGAGKTTLLNTLAQQQSMGVVSGEIAGHKLGSEFQRGTGFCKQMDLHDGTATIREALEFSAILRQDREIPR